MIDFQERADQYITDVLSGTIPACKWVRFAVERQQRDLGRQDDPAFPYRYEPSKGQRVCEFISRSPHVKGRKYAGKPLIPEPWQAFIIMTLFGWVNKEDGFRRYRHAYCEIPKGNGKSPLAAALCDYMAFADGEPGAEVYTAAHGIKQARVVFDTSRSMLEKMPRFLAKAGVVVGQHSIYQQHTGSSIKPLSREAKIAEGSLPYFVCCDELHVWPKRELYDNLATANEKRDGSLMFSITTAGSDLAGICYEQHDYVTKILDGVLTDETYFGIIFTIDEGDDYWSDITWRKANPNWGVSVNPASIANKAQRAKQKPAEQASFLTKHLGVWQQTDHAWMDMRRFALCADPKLKESDLIKVGVPCVFGTDLAAKLDLAALMRIYWRKIDGKAHYYVFGRYWTNRGRMDATSNAAFGGWEKQGILQVFEGDENDFDSIEADIRSDAKRCKPQLLCYDPRYAAQIIQHLQHDVQCVEVTQSTKDLSEPMKEIEAAVYAGRFHFDGDPVLTWSMSNVVCHLDKNDNYFPNKSKPENNIDPVTAMLTGMNRVIALSSQSSKPRRTEILLYKVDDFEND